MSGDGVREIMARAIGHKLYRVYDPRDIEVATSGSGTAYMVAGAAIAALNAAGFVIVPREPTDTMADRGESSLMHDPDLPASPRMAWAHAKSCWQAMISAAAPIVEIPHHGKVNEHDRKMV